MSISTLHHEIESKLINEGIEGKKVIVPCGMDASDFNKWKINFHVHTIKGKVEVVMQERSDNNERLNEMIAEINQLKT